MEKLFLAAVIGHLVGDYLLQNKKMALTKTEKSVSGWLFCLFHCVIYTLCLCFFTRLSNFPFVTLIFVSHLLIDKFSLGMHWLKLIRGRDILKALNSREEFREADIAFSCFVYAVVDNTFHLLVIWFYLSF